MTIALSATVKPSRLERLLLGGMLTGFLAVALVTMYQPEQQGMPYAPAWLVGVNTVLVLFLTLLLFKKRKTCYIRISGQGVISLGEKETELFTVYEHVRWVTLTPYLIALCVERQTGEKKLLRIFSDTVDAHTFSALTVALKHILVSRAAHHRGYEDKNTQ